MAHNAKLFVLVVKATFFAAMAILEAMSGGYAILEDWSTSRDLSVAMAALNTAQCLCKLVINVTAFMHLVAAIGQHIDNPEDDADPDTENDALLPPLADEEHAIVNIEADLTQDETDPGVRVPALGPEDEKLRAEEVLPPATLSGLSASAQMSAALVTSAGAGPARSAAPVPARAAAPDPVNVWSWRPAPAASSDEEM